MMPVLALEKVSELEALSPKGQKITTWDGPIHRLQRRCGMLSDPFYKELPIERTAQKSFN